MIMEIKPTAMERLAQIAIKYPVSPDTVWEAWEMLRPLNGSDEVTLQTLEKFGEAAAHGACFRGLVYVLLELLT